MEDYLDNPICNRQAYFPKFLEAMLIHCQRLGNGKKMINFMTTL